MMSTSSSVVSISFSCAALGYGARLCALRGAPRRSRAGCAQIFVLRPAVHDEPGVDVVATCPCACPAARPPYTKSPGRPRPAAARTRQGQRAFRPPASTPCSSSISARSRKLPWTMVSLSAYGARRSAGALDGVGVPVDGDEPAGRQPLQYGLGVSAHAQRAVHIYPVRLYVQIFYALVKEHRYVSAHQKLSSFIIAAMYSGVVSPSCTGAQASLSQSSAWSSQPTTATFLTRPGKVPQLLGQKRPALRVQLALRGAGEKRAHLLAVHIGHRPHAGPQSSASSPRCTPAGSARPTR